MPTVNIFRVTQRAQEIVTQRFMRWYEDLLQSQDESTGADASQEEKRTAYQLLTQLTPDEFEVALPMFEQQYGAGEFDKQAHLAYRNTVRQQRGQGR